MIRLLPTRAVGRPIEVPETVRSGVERISNAVKQAADGSEHTMYSKECAGSASMLVAAMQFTL